MSSLADLLMGTRNPDGSQRAQFDEHPVFGQVICSSCDEPGFGFTCRGGHRLCKYCILPMWTCPFPDCPGRVPAEATRRQSKREAPVSTEEASTQTGADLSSEKTEASQQWQTAQDGQLDSRSDVPEASQQSQTAQKGLVDSRSDLPKACLDLDFIGCQRPPNWTAPADVHQRQGYALVKISPYSLEGQKVLQLIPGLPLSSVMGIERLENRDLYESFCLKKRQMSRTMSPQEINERDLSCVIKKNRVDVVARYGNDFRNILEDTSRFGQGSHFDIRVDLKEKLAQGTLVCVFKVLCGSCDMASPNSNCPQDINDGQPYNICVDSLSNSKVVINSENGHSYPCYFVHVQ